MRFIKIIMLLTLVGCQYVPPDQNVNPVDPVIELDGPQKALSNVTEKSVFLIADGLADVYQDLQVSLEAGEFDRNGKFDGVKFEKVAKEKSLAKLKAATITISPPLQEAGGPSKEENLKAIEAGFRKAMKYYER